MAATWDQKPVPEYSAQPPPGAPPAQLPTPSPIQYQQTGQPQQYFQEQPGQHPQMQQTSPQGIPQQPQVVYMQQSPGVPGQPGHPQSIPMQQTSPDPHGAQPQHGAQPGGAPGRTFQNVTPLASLGRSPAPVDCPACGQRSMTRIAFLAGNYTHGWAVGLCCLTWFFCWVPYVVDGFKNVDHSCGSCGVLLATWHRSGGVDVHQHQ
ncbi:hypothetical protein HYFRA_00002590 [Hymenoscyphus fraxineus]|uniref:LITAF domain-containing protein n=1 Tax=Hymenoscyphus fraxineus TaxID=746836 RepID=A0A9N9L7T0_9HELO|nr:hypothetical protein HYFRA_00002590 [Hymenoscyphus fraxineus]